MAAMAADERVNAFECALRDFLKWKFQLSTQANERQPKQPQRPTVSIYSCGKINILYSVSSGTGRACVHWHWVNLFIFWIVENSTIGCHLLDFSTVHRWKNSEKFILLPATTKETVQRKTSARNFSYFEKTGASLPIHRHKIPTRRCRRVRNEEYGGRGKEKKGPFEVEKQ